MEKKSYNILSISREEQALLDPEKEDRKNRLRLDVTVTEQHTICYIRESIRIYASTPLSTRSDCRVENIRRAARAPEETLFHPPQPHRRHEDNMNFRLGCSNRNTVQS